MDDVKKMAQRDEKDSHILRDSSAHTQWKFVRLFWQTFKKMREKK